jgi:hypothetical protein
MFYHVSIQQSIDLEPMYFGSQLRDTICRKITDKVGPDTQVQAAATNIDVARADVATALHDFLQLACLLAVSFDHSVLHSKSGVMLLLVHQACLEQWLLLAAAVQAGNEAFSSKLVLLPVGACRSKALAAQSTVTSWPY